jgi:hypothetical protein
VCLNIKYAEFMPHGLEYAGRVRKVAEHMASGWFLIEQSARVKMHKSVLPETVFAKSGEFHQSFM